MDRKFFAKEITAKIKELLQGINGYWFEAAIRVTAKPEVWMECANPDQGSIQPLGITDKAKDWFVIRFEDKKETGLYLVRQRRVKVREQFADYRLVSTVIREATDEEYCQYAGDLEKIINYMEIKALAQAS